MKCYCGNHQPFEQCCFLIINGSKKAETPEQLMRSRYSAYAIKNAQYIYHTYALKSQKEQSIEEIKAWAEQTQWLKLTIKNTNNCFTANCNDLENIKDITGENSSLPTVEFCALYIHNKSFCQMSEISRFTLESSLGKNQWRYLDGEIVEHIEISPPKRNELCLCQSKKKFKHCCSSKLT